MFTKRLVVILAVLCLVYGFVGVQAAESERDATEKLYRDYTESYQKAAEAYEKSVKQGQINTYVSCAVAAGFIFLIFAISLRTQRFYNKRAIQVHLANQKLLEEIRDLLKKNRP